MSRTSAVNDELAVIIPTRHRPNELHDCLESLATQFMVPGLVIIADSSDDTLSAAVTAQFRGSLPDVKYVACAEAGVTAQRNEALRHLRSSLSFVAFADDDVVFDAHYFNQIVSLLAVCPAVVGAAGVSTEPRNRGRSLDSLLQRLFLLGAKTDKGQVLPSGVNVPPPRQGPSSEVGWLFGCAVYRRKLFASNRFSDELRGYGAYEDVDFSMCARRLGSLVVIPQATLEHRHSPASRISVREFHASSIANRHRLVSSHRDQGLIPVAYWWSVLGLLLFAFASLVHHRNERSRAVFQGTCLGAARATRQAGTTWREARHHPAQGHACPRESGRPDTSSISTARRRSGERRS